MCAAVSVRAQGAQSAGRPRWRGWCERAQAGPRGGPLPLAAAAGLWRAGRSPQRGRRAAAARLAVGVAVDEACVATQRELVRARKRFKVHSRGERRQRRLRVQHAMVAGRPGLHVCRAAADGERQVARVEAQPAAAAGGEEQGARSGCRAGVGGTA
eukprot:4689233-Prymnesium_polylepis.1